MASTQTDLSRRLTDAKFLATHGQLATIPDLVEESLTDDTAPHLTEKDIDALIWLIQYCYLGYSRLDRLDRLRCLIDRGQVSLSNEVANLLAAELCLALQDHEGFLRKTSLLADRPVAGLTTRARSLISVRQRLASPAFPDYQREIVFGIGLSRTGTSSLNSALIELGISSVHWVNPHTQEPIQWHDFFLFEGFTDIPVTYQFETLYHAFPKSRFIYTNRDRDSWVRSVSAHYERRHGVTKPADLSKKVFQRRLNLSPGWVEQSLYAQHASWADSYEAFDRRVRAFFADKPENRFLELRICEGDGWHKLCKFLERDIPAEGFPHRHKAGPRANAHPST